MEHEFTTQIPCPACARELSISWTQQSMPYFDGVMLVSARCECGFRFSDVMLLDSRGPSRHVLDVLGEDDLKARVVRSTSCTIRIPELGVQIEPATHAEAFVSNVEGVLERVEDVLRATERWSAEEGDERKTERCRQLLNTIADIRSGNRSMTLILEDPMGNSTILSERAICEPLTYDEVKRLSRGGYTPLRG
ncbi:MAG: zinc finger protein [Methanosarcinales archaeon]|nr:zinc finger protein [Methanosarcinales archaeon]